MPSLSCALAGAADVQMVNKMFPFSHTAFMELKVELWKKQFPYMPHFGEPMNVSEKVLHGHTGSNHTLRSQANNTFMVQLAC